MSDLALFLPITKVDADQRLVYGLATAEVADRAGEICDYATTKPYYEAWSAAMNAASRGKSLGALRAMHGRVAAGKITDISFDDAGKRILVAAKIVDDEEWRKVEEGVYTGFSQGGRYVRRWADPGGELTRYTAEPSEISLVDLPCVPAATFEVIKDGVVKRRAFATPTPNQDAPEAADDDDEDSTTGAAVSTKWRPASPRSPPASKRSRRSRCPRARRCARSPNPPTAPAPKAPARSRTRSAASPRCRRPSAPMR
jgi:hypothetical protein